MNLIDRLAFWWLDRRGWIEKAYFYDLDRARGVQRNDKGGQRRAG